MREGLLTLHILGVAGWIGGGLYAWFSTTQLARGRAGGALRTIGEKANRYFGPVALTTLLTGIALVWTEDAWAWNDLFVLFGIGAFVFSAVFQPLVSSKTEQRLLSAADGDGDVGTALRSAHVSAAIELGVLVVVLWSMVAKLGA